MKPDNQAWLSVNDCAERIWQHSGECQKCLKHENCKQLSDLYDSYLRAKGALEQRRKQP